MSISPFTAVMRTVPPASIGASLFACHSSPWTSTIAGAPGVSAARTSAHAVPDQRVGPRDGRLPLGRQGKTAEHQHASRENEDDQQDDGESHTHAGHPTRHHEREPTIRLIAPPIPSAPKLDTFSSRMRSPSPNRISSSPVMLTGRI